jgi:5'-nucleotidase
MIVVAPLTEASGAGAGIGPVHLRQGGIHAEPVTPAGLEGIEAIAAEALPALIVITACLGGFGPVPDLVASGINPGRNVGRAVLHSGTVGAALTSVHFGLKGLATSIQAGVPSTYESADGSHIHFESAAALAVEFAARLETAPPRTVLNLNVPNLPLSKIRGVRRAHLANTGLNFLARVENHEPDVARETTALRTDDERASEEHSDDALSELGWAVVTPLATVSEDERPEVGDFVAAAIASACRLIGS